MKRLWSYLVPSLILTSALVLQHDFPAQVEIFQNRVFDIFQRIKPRTFKATPVRIIDIDDESLSKLGQWPWPRPLLAKLVRRASEGGAKVIAFDGIFAEPDRTSPENVLPLWAENASVQLPAVPMGKIVGHDILFSEAIAESRVVTAFSLDSKQNSSVPSVKWGIAERGAVMGDTATNYLEPTYHGAVTSLPILENAAIGNGSINMDKDHDGVLRRVPLFFSLNETVYPSLVAETIRVAEKATMYKITLAGTKGWETGFAQGFEKVRIGQFDIPTDSKGRLWLYDTRTKPERYIPAWKVLSDDVTFKTLKGKILFVGTSAAGLKDLRTTPLTPLGAGVEVHAQLAEQILLGDFLQRPYWAKWAEPLYFIILGLFLIILLPATGAVLCAVIAGVAIAFALGFSWYAFDEMHFLLDPVLPSVIVLLIYLVSSFLNYLRTETERSHIRSAFSRYLSPDLVKKLTKDPKQLKLGGEIKAMTFLFTDIRGFTSLSETMSAEELTQFMNSFMTPMSEIILKHGGTIDKYIGDCIMAFWNAPIEDKDHARHACLAALEMLRFLQGWNESRRQEAGKLGKPFLEVRIGIGVNTGEACVGNMGSEYRFDYTVLGDEVNLASRLEGLTKQYNVSLLLGENTAEKVPDLNPRELDTIQVRGKTKPTKIFSLP